MLPDDEVDDALAAVVDVTIRLDGGGTNHRCCRHDTTDPHDAAALTGESVGAPQDRLRALRLLAETAERQADHERAVAYRDRAATAAERAPAAACEVHGDWLDSQAV